MNTNADELDLKDRLSLIETMIAEGRRTTESYGWTFLLWGVAYYVAIAWSSFSHYSLAWPITMISAGALMAAFIWFKNTNRAYSPKNAKSRAIWSIWIATGSSMFILLDAMGFSGRLTDWRISIAVASTLIGSANAASSLTLRWRLQFACAVVWWATAIVACYGTETQTSIAFLAAIFLCQIVFGGYLMIAEHRQCRKVASHA